MQHIASGTECTLIVNPAKTSGSQVTSSLDERQWWYIPSSFTCHPQYALQHEMKRRLDKNVCICITLHELCWAQRHHIIAAYPPTILAMFIISSVTMPPEGMPACANYKSRVTSCSMMAQYEIWKKKKIKRALNSWHSCTLQVKCNTSHVKYHLRLIHPCRIKSQRLTFRAVDDDFTAEYKTWAHLNKTAVQTYTAGCIANLMQKVIGGSRSNDEKRITLQRWERWILPSREFLESNPAIKEARRESGKWGNRRKAMRSNEFGCELNCG